MTKTRYNSDTDGPQQRLTVTPEELMVRAPLRQALGQMRADEEWSIPSAATRWFFDGPPKMKPVPPDAPNLIGVRWGRIEVIGLLEKAWDGRRCPVSKASWVVRCDCGIYETRRTSSILRKSNPNERCQACSHLEDVQRKAFFAEYGHWPAR